MRKRFASPTQARSLPACDGVSTGFAMRRETIKRSISEERVSVFALSRSSVEIPPIQRAISGRKEYANVSPNFFAAISPRNFSPRKQIRDRTRRHYRVHAPIVAYLAFRRARFRQHLPLRLAYYFARPAHSFQAGQINPSRDFYARVQPNLFLSSAA